MNLPLPPFSYQEAVTFALRDYRSQAYSAAQASENLQDILKRLEEDDARGYETPQEEAQFLRWYLNEVLLVKNALEVTARRLESDDPRVVALEALVEVASPQEEEEDEGPLSPSHEHLISGGTPGEQGKSLSEEEDAGAPVVLEPVAGTSLKEAPSLDTLLESEGLGGEPVEEVPSSVPVLGDDPLTELYFSGGALKEASSEG